MVVRWIPFGIAAVVWGFVLKSPGTRAGPVDVELRLGIPVFGTDIFRLRAPIGSQHPVDRVRVASLGPQVGSDAAADERDILADTPASASRNASFDERFAALDYRSASFGPPDVDGRTAIYDITAHAVYLPNGRRLEAHSGLGGLMDNPRHAQVRMRGATPPNVYNLSLRERLFHGVRAIRLTPVDSGRMYGRDGILAHSYMHGSNGQSNGCVAFSNYPEFLNAFLKGEVTRLVVVERLENPPGPKVASGWLPDVVRNLLKASDRSGQYAAGGGH